MRFKRETDLQTMCLYVIVENLETFSLPNKCIELQIEFLRRLYSDRLYELIERKCLLPEKYLEWLISPYWKHVCLPGSGYSVDAIVRKLRVTGTVISSLNLLYSSSSPDILSAIICCVPNISQLNLGWTYCADDTLSLIRKMCSNLIVLNLSNCKNITDAGMKKLCSVKNKESGLSSLKMLDICRTSVTSKGIAYVLKHMSLLTLNHEGLSCILYKLYHSNTQKYMFSLVNFGHCRSEANLQHILETWTAICPNVEYVSIEDKITEHDLQLIEKFKHLTRIKLVNKRDLRHDFPRRDPPRGVQISPLLLIRGALITRIEMFNLTVSAEVITRVCHNLKKLFLCTVTFEDFSVPVEEVHKLPNLESLTVKHVMLKKKNAERSLYLLIHSALSLNELCIQYVENFTDDLADVILRTPCISVVDFSFTDIKCPTLMRFFNCKRVTKIRADGCPFISEREEFGILKLINDSQYGNTCSWEIDYSEMEKEPLWHSNVWNEDQLF